MSTFVNRAFLTWMRGMTNIRRPAACPRDPGFLSVIFRTALILN